MAVTTALIKAGEKALTKGAEKAIEKSTEKAVSKALTRGLIGETGGKLAKFSGSTLDGILGKSSGLKLSNARIKPTTLAEYSEGAYNTIGDMMNDGLTMKDIKDVVSKKNFNTIKEAAKDWADVQQTPLDLAGVSSKSQLPKLNREEYLKDTIGSVRNGKGAVVGADIPSNMQGHMNNDPRRVGSDNASIMREAFGGEGNLDDMYERYEALTELPNANEIYTPENIDNGLMLSGKKKSDEVTQDLADRLFGNKRDIEVSSRSSGAKNVKVGRLTANAGVEDAVAETAPAINSALAEDVAALKAQVGSQAGSGAGMGGNIGGGTATQLPGSEGFNVKLKEGKTTNIPLRDSAVGSSKQQRAVRKLDDMTAKSMNANVKQYRNVVGKSGSIDGHYKSVAERMRAEKIDQANVSQKAQNALSLREDIKQQGLQYAEANGVKLDLSGIDNTVGLSPTQKRKLAELGLSLDDMLGGSAVVTPTQAEDIYKALRDYAYKWEDSNDAVTAMAGKAMKKEADAVRDIIDNTMDSINVDYKTSLLEGAANNGEDPAYLRKLAGKPDFKFSDLRKDQSDWLTINDLAGNKIKDEPTLNVFGVDTGATNPFTSGAQKIKEKIYERQAYGGGRGAGGSGGTGGANPLAGDGAENNVNFTTAGERAGTLGNLLGKAKGAGMIGAGILGGMMLGGGGGSNNAEAGMTPSEYESTMDATGYDAGQIGSGELDPYAGMTLNGYTMDDLEQGYVNALNAGDKKAAELIAGMIDVLNNKVERYYATAKAQKSLSDSGSDTGKKQKAAMNVLSSLMSNYDAQGPIGGRFTQFMNAITGGGYNPSVSAYDTGAAGSLGTIIKALGDTGALSEGDQKRALELLPKTTDSEQAAQMKYQQLMQILQGAGV